MAKESRRSNREGTIFRIKGRTGYRAQVTMLDWITPHEAVPHAPGSE